MSLLTRFKSLFGFKTEVRPISKGDRLLDCEDCHKRFVFDEGEQRFFKDKGFSDPKRCPNCRKKVRSRMRRRFRPPSANHHRSGHHRKSSPIDGESPYADER